MDVNVKKPIVIIESPLSGNFEANLKYLRKCIKDSLTRGEAPYASHAIYPQVLDDTIPEERKLGMEAGFAFIPVSDFTAVYEDRGISGGMKEGIKKAKECGHSVEFRQIGDD